MLGERIGQHAADAGEDAAGQVQVGIETDRGPWVQALIAAGYTVFAVNPLQAARYRERLGVSGAKSDNADAHMLADMVRTDAHQLRPVAGDSAKAEAVKVVTRMHKTLIWERTRAGQRLRHALREYFPAALAAFQDLDAADTLELLARAPDPASAARLSLAQISAALHRARRRDIAAKATTIQAVLRGPQLGQPAVVTAAYAATTRALVAVLATLNEQVKALQEQGQAHFGRHPDAEIIRSQPGLGATLGARVLAEFGHAPGRYASAKARKNYAATSPITRASDKKKIVAAGSVRAQRPAHRRADDPGVRVAAGLAGRQGLLRPATRSWRRPQRRVAPTRQPARRHPARLPQDPHTLRRDHRLVASPQRRCCLTFKLLGCLSSEVSRL
jgi:transposase